MVGTLVNVAWGIIGFGVSVGGILVGVATALKELEVSVATSTADGVDVPTTVAMAGWAVAASGDGVASGAGEPPRSRAARNTAIMTVKKTRINAPIPIISICGLTLFVSGDDDVIC